MIKAVRGDPTVRAAVALMDPLLAIIERYGRQLAALSELCELLSIGTEDSMSAMSVDVFVPLLVGLLRKEHNADIMLLASRANEMHALLGDLLVSNIELSLLCNFC